MQLPQMGVISCPISSGKYVVRNVRDEPADDWEVDPDLKRRNDAAVARLGDYVASHVYDMYIASAKTGHEAMENLRKAYGGKNPFEVTRLKSKLQQLRYEPGTEPSAYVIEFDAIVTEADCHSEKPMLDAEKAKFLFGNLPVTVFWNSWREHYEEGTLSWIELRTKFLRAAARDSSLNGMSAGPGTGEFAAATRPVGIPKYVEGQDLTEFCRRLKALGYPVCPVHRTFSHTEAKCTGLKVVDDSRKPRAVNTANAVAAKSSKTTNTDESTTASPNGIISEILKLEI